MSRTPISRAGRLLLITAGLALALSGSACTKKKKKSDDAKDGMKAGMAMGAPLKAMPPRVVRKGAPRKGPHLKRPGRPVAKRPARLAAAFKPAAAPASLPGGLGNLIAKVPVPAKAAKTYTVKLERPKTVGLRYRLQNKGQRKTRLTAGGQVVPKQTRQYFWTYSAIVTIKAVSAKGKATKEEHQVVKFEITEAGKTRVVAPKGAKILAEVVNGKEIFKINGVVAKGIDEDVIDTVVSLDDGKEQFDADAIFGPGKPVAIGASWNVNAGKMLASFLSGPFKDAALKPTVADVSGKAKLVAAKVIQGMPALVIQAKATIKNVAPKMGPVKATGGRLSFSIAGWGPQDLTAFGGGKRMRMIMHVEGDLNQKGKIIKFIMDFDQSAEDMELPIK